MRLDGLVVANLHATNDFRHPQIAAAEVVRAEAFVTGVAGSRPCILAGDFNLRAEHLLELAGWSARGPGIDHVLVRGLDRVTAHRLAGRSPPSQWRGALRPRAGGGDDRVTPAEARALFPVLERLAYLNAGTFGPVAQPTADAVRAQLDDELEHGRFGKEYFERMLGLRTEARAALGSLVGAPPEQVSLTGSTTDGCNIVLGGLGLGPEDEVVTTREEHFGLLGPLHASGARVVVVDADPEAILAAVTPRTRLLALSQVLWTTGRVLPVRELREQTGVPVLVDGAQSVGAIPVDVQGLDFLTISGQKWLCGPDATGALVVADPERLRVARPSYFSQTAYEETGSYEPAVGAARFDPGWVATASLAGLVAALALPPEWRFERAAAMAARCRELLAPLVERRPGGRDARRLPRGGSAGARRDALRRGTSSSATCPAPASSASRAAGGRTRTTSSALSPRSPEAAPKNLRSVRRRRQAELLRDRLQRGDDVRDVLVQLDADQLGARVDLVAVHAGRERRLLQLLLAPTSAPGPSRPVGRTSPQACTKPESSSQAKSVFFSGVSRGISRCSACERTASITTSG